MPKRDVDHRDVERRFFLRHAAGLLALGLLPFPLPGLRVRPVREPSSSAVRPRAEAVRRSGSFAEELAGEEFFFDISFLWVFRAAVGRISFTRAGRGRFKTAAEAQATGFVGWVTKYRELGFYSTLRVKNDEGRPRLVTTRFERRTVREDRRYRSFHRFNYRTRRWSYKVYRNGKLKKARTRDIPEGIWYDDFVGAAYNFRLGVYGEIRKGLDITVNTIPNQGVSEFTAHVCTEEEQQERERSFMRWVEDAEYVVHLPIDQRLFGFRAGLAKFLMREDLVPLAARVQDATTFGNVSAKITNPPPLRRRTDRPG